MDCLSKKRILEFLDYESLELILNKGVKDKNLQKIGCMYLLEDLTIDRIKMNSGLPETTIETSIQRLLLILSKSILKLSKELEGAASDSLGRPPHRQNG